MYQITAVLNHSSLSDVMQGLRDEGIEGITITEVMGKGTFGFSINDLDEKVMLTIVVSTDLFKNKVMDTIRINAQDLGHGSGKMWVTPVLEVERIRTGEKNEAALTQSKNKSKIVSYENYFTSADTPSS